jgi:hypothetical protein
VIYISLPDLRALVTTTTMINILDRLRAGRLRGSKLESRRSEYFSLLRIVQTGSGAHPAFYSMGSRGFFPGDKYAGV